MTDISAPFSLSYSPLAARPPSSYEEEDDSRRFQSLADVETLSPLHASIHYAVSQRFLR